jgi:alkanesulfonate monooxygenase SsuD/methylene tetrahydromethanopterin reductase-like flavin-dependent oxidoreductase (luciferase family)
MRRYDTFWMAEHHFQPEGTELIPNLLMMAMHLCGVTKKLNIGCGFNIVPMWHPLRLAEDYAMADILTGVRVIFGVGRGYHTREVETFGNPLIDRMPTARCSRRASKSCSRPSRACRSRTRASTTRSRRPCRIAATP